MLSNKILKDGMTKTKENWDYIGKVLAACLNAELIPAYILLSVRIVLLHTFDSIHLSIQKNLF